jgi:catechol 2,3-dioxygenase-like lactoylglutathione lyase family enzyme
VERVTGIGGLFLRSEDPTGLLEWYRRHLGLDGGADDGGAESGAALLWWREDRDPDRRGSTTWAPFPADTAYFGPRSAQFMVNYRVRDLDAMLRQLRDAGVEVDETIEEMEYGRFGWAVDRDGNRCELWEPAEGM